MRRTAMQMPKVGNIGFFSMFSRGMATNATTQMAWSNGVQHRREAEREAASQTVGDLYETRSGDSTMSPRVRICIFDAYLRAEAPNALVPIPPVSNWEPFSRFPMRVIVWNRTI